MYTNFKAKVPDQKGAKKPVSNIVKRDVKKKDAGLKNTDKKKEVAISNIDKKNEVKTGIIANRILNGDVDAARSVEKKSIRLFISSTFTDTKVERNHLMKHVFPELRDYCQKKGITFTVVDMRWGIRDEATNDHMTTEICLNEIDKCYELTIEGAPCFMYLSFDRYGYRPIPRTLSQRDFESIVKLCTEESAETFKKWYKLDANAVPPLYTLQPISTHLPEFSENLPKEQKRGIMKSWSDDENAMRDAVLNPANNIEDEIRKIWAVSVTEKEVRRGPLSTENVSKNSLCIVRSIAQLRTLDLNSEDVGAVHRFIDVVDNNGKRVIDEESATQIQYLRSEIEGKTTAVSETVKWVKPQGISEDTHNKYLTKLSGEVKLRLLNGITSAIDGQAQLDEFTSDVASHLRFADKRSQGFYGRKDLIKEAFGYFENNEESKCPLVIYGISGAGKTSLVAALAFRAKKSFVENGKTPVFCIRFCGTSPKSTSGNGLLQSLCMQLVRTCDGNVDYEPPENYHKLIDEFKRLIQKASELKPIIIFIDSLDQLNDDNRARSDLEWLPISLPRNVYLVISTLENIGGSYKKLKQSDIPKDNYVEVKQLTTEDAETIMKGWLKEAKRTLVDFQFESVMEVALDSSIEPPTALRLRLLFDIAKEITSFEIRDEMLPNTVRGLINLIFENLENRHGMELVRNCFGFISASKNGLSELELMDLLSCSEDVLNSVFQYHKPPTRRLPFACFARLQNDMKDYIVERGANGKSVLSWYHRQFWEAAASRYFLSPLSRIKCCTMILDYYSGAFAKKHSDRNIPKQPLVWKDGSKKIVNESKVAELPHAFSVYLSSIGELLKIKDALNSDDEELTNYEPRVKEFGEMIFDLKFLSTSCKTGVARDLIKYFSTVDNEFKPKDFADFIKFLNGTIHVIEQFPLLTVQQGLSYPKTNRMYKAAAAFADTAKLPDAYPWLPASTVLPLVTQVNRIEVEDPCLMTLSGGHKGEIKQCRLVGTFMLSMCKSGILAVWNVISGDLLYRMGCLENVETFLAVPCHDSKTDYFVISGHQDGKVALIKIILGQEVTGDMVISFLAHPDQKIRTMVVTNDSRRLVTGTDYAIIKEHTDEAYENESNFGDIAVWNLTSLIEDSKEECITRKEKFIEEQNIFCLQFLPDESALMVGYGNRLNGQVLVNRVGIYSWPSLETIYLDEKAKYDYFYFEFIKDDGDGTKDNPFKLFVTTTLHLDRYNLYKNDESKFVFELVWRTDVGTGVHYAGLFVSPDRKYVSCAQQSNILLYNAYTGGRSIRLRGHGGTVWGIEMATKTTEKGVVRYLYSASGDKTMKVWEIDDVALKDFETSTPASHDCTCSSVIIAPCETKIITGSDRGRNLADLRVWAAKDAEYLGRTNQWTDRFDAIKLTKDQKFVLTRSDIFNEVRYIPYERFHEFKINILNSWDWIYVTLPGNEAERCVCHGSKCLEISADGKQLLACGSAQSGVFLVDAETKKYTCLEHEGDGVGGCFSPDGSYVVTYSNGFRRQGNLTKYEDCGVEVPSELKRWQLKKSPVLLNTKTATESELKVVDWRWPRRMRGYSSARYSPDGKYLITAIWTGCLQIRNPKTLDVTKEIQAHAGIIHAVRFSSTGKFLVTGGDDQWVKIWHVPSIKKAAEFYVGRGVECLDMFSQKDKNLLRMVCGDAGGNVKILEIKNIAE